MRQQQGKRNYLRPRELSNQKPENKKEKLPARIAPAMPSTIKLKLMQLIPYMIYFFNLNGFA